MFNFKRKKYYLVVYSFSNANGFLTMTSENMDYLNRERTVELIKDKCKDTEVEGNVIITNIIKLSKKEYECWCEEK